MKHIISLVSRRRNREMRFQSVCSCGEADHLWHSSAGLAHNWGDRHLEKVKDND